jgi:hypothetical protein
MLTGTVQGCCFTIRASTEGLGADRTVAAGATQRVVHELTRHLISPKVVLGAYSWRLPDMNGKWCGRTGRRRCGRRSLWL